MEIDTYARPRVLVFGAGAVGCFLGGMLAGAGCAVTLLGREELAASIRTSGLDVIRHRHAQTVHPRVITSVNELDDYPDIVLLATRAYAVHENIPDLQRVTTQGTTLVTTQNGIGTEELIEVRLPGVALVAGSLTMSAEFTGPGRVESTSRSGGIALAPASNRADAAHIARLFGEAALPVSIQRDYRSMKWSKLILNMMANATSAILDWTPARVYEHQALFALERAAVLEAVAVLRAEGSHLVSLPGFPVPLLPWLFRFPTGFAQSILRRRVGGGRGDKLPSLQLDLQAGRDRTEARWMYGAIVDAGIAKRIPTPVNRRLLRIIEGVTRNPVLRDAFRDRPERLLRNVALADCRGTINGEW